MYNAPYAMNIGQDTLFYRVSLLWKKSVQHGDNYLDKSVGSLPHSPHLVRGKDLESLVLPTKERLSPKDTLPLPADLSTPKSRKITETKADLYPQSTEPTITTITYINRRGTQL